MTWPVIILWILIICAMWSRGPWLLYLFGSTAVFGSMTMLPPSIGTNVPPQALCEMLLIGKMICHRPSLAKAASLAFDLKRLGFLFLFLVYGLVSAIILPRFFAGQVMVITLDNAMRGEVPITPSFANLSQGLYLGLSVGMAFVVAVRAADGTFRRQYLHSVLLAAILLLVSGLADLITSSAGHADMLSAFHNASYSLLTDVELVGQKRVVGFMPEASTYGFTCVTFLSFLSSCYEEFPGSQRRFMLPVIMTALAIMAFLSTSSTAFIGLGVLTCVFAFRLLPRIVMARYGNGRRSVYIIWAIMGLSLAGAGIVAFVPSFTQWVSGLLNAALFTKVDSSSYEIRSNLTHSAVENFWQTNGLGVGLGSARTSNWFVSVLACTGILGAALLALALMAALLPLALQREGAARRFGRRLAWFFVPIAAMMFVAGSTSDPGVFNMAALGLLVAAARQQNLASRPIELRRQPGFP